MKMYELLNEGVLIIRVNFDGHKSKTFKVTGSPNDVINKARSKLQQIKELNSETFSEWQQEDRVGFTADEDAIMTAAIEDLQDEDWN